jgi:hypothetical protein
LAKSSIGVNLREVLKQVLLITHLIDEELHDVGGICGELPLHDGVVELFIDLVHDR